MKKTQKIILVIILIVIPVSVVLFLHTFGKNEYSIPIYYESGMPDSLACITETAQHTIPAFKFTTQNSEELTSEVLTNQVTVVNFFSTDCEQDCAKIAASLASVQDNFATKEIVKILSISTENDSNASLKNFSKKYHSNEDRWTFLTGSSATAIQLADCGFGLSADSGSKKYPVETVVLVDGEKRIRGYYDLTDSEDTERLILEIRILLYEMNT